MKNFNFGKRVVITTLALSVLGLSACGGGSSSSPAAAPAAVPGGVAAGVLGGVGGVVGGATANPTQLYNTTWRQTTVSATGTQYSIMFSMGSIVVYDYCSTIYSDDFTSVSYVTNGFVIPSVITENVGGCIATLNPGTATYSANGYALNSLMTLTLPGMPAMQLQRIQ